MLMNLEILVKINSIGKDSFVGKKKEKKLEGSHFWYLYGMLT